MLTGSRWQRVKWAVDEYDRTNQIPSPKKRGHPPKNASEVNKFIINSTFQNRFSLCKSQSDQLKSQSIGNVSPTSVVKYRKNLNLILKLQKLDNFSHSMLTSNFESEKNILSDESRFCQMDEERRDIRRCFLR